MAVSKSDFLLVAAISSTSVLDSNESIFLKRVESTLLLPSCILSFLAEASASISSIKIIVFPIYLQASQISANFFSLSP